MSALDRLRIIAERPSPGAWYSQGEVSDWTHNGSETTPTPEADAEFIVTFDPPTVLALLDVAEAAAPLVNHVGKSQDGEWDAAEERLSDALDRLREVSS